MSEQNLSNIFCCLIGIVAMCAKSWAAKGYKVVCVTCKMPPSQNFSHAHFSYWRKYMFSTFLQMFLLTAAVGTMHVRLRQLYFLMG